MDEKQCIIDGKTLLGVELGSTRIKSVLISGFGESGKSFAPLASGSHDWENRLENGLWTYSLDDVWAGLQSSFRSLAGEVQNRYGVPLEKTGAIGISAMMHGYLAFNRAGELLVPFRTWRNTTTEKAAALLSERFRFNIPQRWCIAHLYQAILDGEDHVKELDFFTTLAGYVHWKLSGKKVLGLDDASGMFPIDSAKGQFNAAMIEQFNVLSAEKKYHWKLEDTLPEVLAAGKNAGALTEAGAKLLDPSGRLKAGIPLCPPEGDAGTGMIATNAVAERTGNISAGTSVFAMIVLEKELSKVYPEIDMVVTPAGKPVAMAHCNNCTSDLDGWVNLFGEFAGASGAKLDKPALYDLLYAKALEGEDDSGGLLSYNYFSGEPVTGLEEGRPLFVRRPDSRFTLANFMRNLLFSAMGTLKIGMDILTEKENVRLDSLLGHGGFFKTKGVGQRLMAAALDTPVSVMESAGEGGAWGIALLAAYMLLRNEGETLENFLAEKVFSAQKSSRIEPDPKDTAGFKKFMERYREGLPIERAAAAHLR